MVAEQLYWRKILSGCFRFILLWLLIAIMKRCTEGFPPNPHYRKKKRKATTVKTVHDTANITYWNSVNMHKAQQHSATAHHLKHQMLLVLLSQSFSFRQQPVLSLLFSRCRPQKALQPPPYLKVKDWLRAMLFNIFILSGSYWIAIINNFYFLVGFKLLRSTLTH